MARSSLAVHLESLTPPQPVLGRLFVLVAAANDYDVLNRKVSEAGITGATNTGACPTGGTANLDTRSWDLPAASFAYDLAGHLAEASSSRIAFT